MVKAKDTVPQELFKDFYTLNASSFITSFYVKYTSTNIQYKYTSHITTFSKHT